MPLQLKQIKGTPDTGPDNTKACSSKVFLNQRTILFNENETKMRQKKGQEA